MFGLIIVIALLLMKKEFMMDGMQITFRFFLDIKIVFQNNCHSF